MLFDVLDAFAYDIDEDVKLTFEFAGVGSSRPEVLLVYEKNGEGPVMKQLDFSNRTAEGSVIASVRLERARFANDGAADSDFSIVSLSGEEVSVAVLQIERSHTTPKPEAFGKILLTVTDDNNAEVPALVGLYDERNRLPLPSAQAIPIRLVSDPDPYDHPMKRHFG